MLNPNQESPSSSIRLPGQEALAVGRAASGFPPASLRVQSASVYRGSGLA